MINNLCFFGNIIVNFCVIYCKNKKLYICINSVVGKNIHDTVRAPYLGFYIPLCAVSMLPVSKKQHKVFTVLHYQVRGEFEGPVDTDLYMSFSDFTSSRSCFRFSVSFCLFSSCAFFLLAFFLFRNPVRKSLKCMGGILFNHYKQLQSRHECNSWNMNKFCSQEHLQTLNSYINLGRKSLKFRSKFKFKY